MTMIQNRNFNRARLYGMRRVLFSLLLLSSIHIAMASRSLVGVYKCKTINEMVEVTIALNIMKNGSFVEVMVVKAKRTLQHNGTALNAGESFVQSMKGTWKSTSSYLRLHSSSGLKIYRGNRSPLAASTFRYKIVKHDDKNLVLNTLRFTVVDANQ